MSPSPTSALVESLCCQLLGLREIDASQSFIRLGGTSIAAEQLASRLSRELGIRINGSDILRQPSLTAVSAMLLEKSTSKELPQL